jgi:hypothetical protein
MEGPPLGGLSYFAATHFGRGWPLAATAVGDSRGSFRGQSGRRKFQPPRQLMTELV